MGFIARKHAHPVGQGMQAEPLLDGRNQLGKLMVAIAAATGLYGRVVGIGKQGLGKTCDRVHTNKNNRNNCKEPK